MFKLIKRLLNKKCDIEYELKDGNTGRSMMVDKDYINTFDKIEEMESALVKEGTSTMQIVCPYCKETQIRSTAIDIIHSPPDYWICDSCNRIMGLLGGRKL